MYKRIIKSASIIIGVAMIATSLMLIAAPGYTFASNVRLVGTDLGLTLSPAGPLFSEANMAPGHSAVSTVTVENNGTNPFLLYVTVDREQGDSALFHSLQLRVRTSSDDATQIYADSLSGARNIAIGSIPARSQRELTFVVDFPGTMGNDMKGKSLSASWVFTATVQLAQPPDGDDPVVIVPEQPIPGGSTTPPVEEPKEPIVEEPVQPELPVEEEPKNAGPPLEEPVEPKPDDKDIVIVLDDPVPGGPTVLPKTGETPYLYFLVAGVILIALGLGLHAVDKKKAV